MVTLRKQAKFNGCRLVKKTLRWLLDVNGQVQRGFLLSWRWN